MLFQLYQPYILASVIRSLKPIWSQVGLAGKITGIHEAFFRELTEAEKAFDEATIRVEDLAQLGEWRFSRRSEKLAGERWCVLLKKQSFRNIKKLLV